jgi:hypothetical protein
MQKTMTNVEQQDARLIAMDAATVAAIRLHAPEFEAAYLADDLPYWFECLLNRCEASAQRVADECRTDPAFIAAYTGALPKLLGSALCGPSSETGTIATKHPNRYIDKERQA